MVARRTCLHRAPPLPCHAHSAAFPCPLVHSLPPCLFGPASSHLPAQYLTFPTFQFLLLDVPFTLLQTYVTTFYATTTFTHYHPIPLLPLPFTLLGGGTFSAHIRCRWLHSPWLVLVRSAVSHVRAASTLHTMPRRLRFRRLSPTPLRSQVPLVLDMPAGFTVCYTAYLYPPPLRWKILRAGYGCVRLPFTRFTCRQRFTHARTTLRLYWFWFWCRYRARWLFCFAPAARVTRYLVCSSATPVTFCLTFDDCYVFSTKHLHFILFSLHTHLDCALHSHFVVI